MFNEYDYDEELMKESVNIISIPQLVTPIVSPRQSTSEREAIFFNLERLISSERLKIEKRIQMFEQKQHAISDQVNKRLADKDRKIR